MTQSSKFTHDADAIAFDINHRNTIKFNISRYDTAVSKGMARYANVEAAKTVGKAIAERAQKAGISTVVFDRGGYVYHGRVKALIDATRAAGLNKHEAAVEETKQESNDKE